MNSTGNAQIKDWSVERLQQGHIRGLLPDEVKERNKALDRLLGMETAEVFLEHLKKKGFQDAAEAWRRRVSY